MDNGIVMLIDTLSIKSDEIIKIFTGKSFTVKH